MFRHRAAMLIPPATLSSLIACFGSTDALAHARWFVDDTQIGLHPEFSFDGLYLAILIGAVLFVTAAVLLEWARKRISFVDRLLGRPMSVPTLVLWRLLAIIFGATLIVNSLAQVFVAPNLVTNGSMVFKIMMFLQVVIGGMFFVQSRLTWASAAVLLMPILCAWEFSILHAVDYAFELTGIGLALMLMAPALAAAEIGIQKRAAGFVPTGFSLCLHTGPRSYDVVWPQATARGRRKPDVVTSKDREASAISILRIMLGLQLIVLAAHDKLLEPGVSLAFVDKYSFVNVPALLGASQFTNLHFVFGSGLAEIAFGSLLLANVATRGVCVILLAMFTTTGFVFGIEEMVGHLPIISMLILLIASGSRQHGAAPVIGRWQIASLACSGAAMLIMVGIFASNGIAIPSMRIIHTLAAAPAVRARVPGAGQTMLEFLAGAETNPSTN
jgi:hypothetical protein